MAETTKEYEALCDRARDFMDDSQQALPSKVMADFVLSENESLTAALASQAERVSKLTKLLNDTADSLGEIIMWLTDDELAPTDDTPEPIAESLVKGVKQLQIARKALDGQEAGKV